MLENRIAQTVKDWQYVTRQQMEYFNSISKQILEYISITQETGSDEWGMSDFFKNDLLPVMNKAKSSVSQAVKFVQRNLS